jgi:phosphatidylglycerophosphatase A
MKFRDRAAVLLATGFTVGNIPFAPGTWGSLLGLPLWLATARVEPAAAAAFVLTVVGAAVWVADEAERALGQKDAQCIVVDEVAGMLVGLAGLPVNAVNCIAAFALFRLMDVLKPFPARWAEQRLRGGWGIVLDDVVAGIYCNLLMRGIGLLWGGA